MQIKHVFFFLLLIVLSGLPLNPARAGDLTPSGTLDSGMVHTPDGRILVGEGVTGGGPCTINRGKKVIFAAANGIILGDGFHAKEESNFQGLIPDTADTDSDGMEDWWEVLYGLNPLLDDAGMDPDQDGLTNGAEFSGKTDPNSKEAPVIVFGADPPDIPRGGTATLSWDITHAETYTLTPGNVAISQAGSIQVSPGESTTYRITATGPGGTSTREITVSINNALPRIIFNAFPPSIVEGASSKLSWTVLNGDTVTLDQDIGTKTVQGEISVTPSVTTIYTLTAVNSEGSSKARVTLTVAHKKPVVTISASPIIVPQGGSTTLTWTSQNGTGASIDNGVGPVPLSGTIQLTPGGTTTYTLTVTGPGGSAHASALVGDGSDTDLDGIPDAWETTYGLDPTDAQDAGLDGDGDLMTNGAEYLAGTDPHAYDNQDLILSAALSGNYTSGGKIIISPQSGQQTIIPSGASHTLTANCSISLLPELLISQGSQVVIRGGDCDQLPDAWEIANFDTLEHGNDSDPDNDGLTNYQEYQINSDPLVADWDTDNDGLNDAWELKYFGSLDQTGDMDSDNDGASNYIEQLTKTDPSDIYSTPKPGNYYEYDALGRIKRLIRIN